MVLEEVEHRQSPYVWNNCLRACTETATRKVGPKVRQEHHGWICHKWIEIWDPRKKKLFISRDVIFDERRKEKPKVFPAADVDESSDELDSEERIVIESENCLEEVQAENVDAEHYEVEDEPVPRPDGASETLDLKEGPSRKRGRPAGETFSEHPVQKRAIKVPSRFNDYHMTHNAESTLAYALSAEAFVDEIPNNIDELKKRSDWRFWKAAIESELLSLKKNGTWTLEANPGNKNIADCK